MGHCKLFLLLFFAYYGLCIRVYLSVQKSVSARHTKTDTDSDTDTDTDTDTDIDTDTDTDRHKFVCILGAN